MPTTDKSAIIKSTISGKKNEITTPSKSDIYNELKRKMEQQRIKDEFCEKRYGQYAYTEYDEDENLFNEDGCQIYLMDYREDIADLRREPNRYVFSEKESKLFYFRSGVPEEVKIDEIDKFNIALTSIMDTKQRKYSTKHLKNDEIYLLITSNGGHKPAIKQPELMAKQNPPQQINNDEMHSLASMAKVMQSNNHSPRKEKHVSKIHSMFHHVSDMPKTNEQVKSNKHKTCLIL